MAGRVLVRILDDFPDITIHKIEVLTSPGQSLKAGIRSIPSLVNGDKSLTGLFLNENKIRTFLESL
jgi:hypothetical protein